MNVTDVPFSSHAETPDQVLERLAKLSPDLTPQLRKAAQHLLDNANDIAISSVREIASDADVKPNTLVRLGRALGFDGYEDFRRPFREELRQGRESFPDRARWLQSLAKGGRHGGLFSDMAASTMENIEQLFAGTTVSEVKAAADAIVAANTTYVVGVGVLYALAHNFAYLAHMALDSVVAVPRDGLIPIDDLARAEKGDVVLAMTFRPYRREVVEAVFAAAEQGAEVIAVTDSLSSPIARGAARSFIVPTETPQFFTSTIGAAALLETVMAFVVADADPEVIASIDSFHKRRDALGIYWKDDDQ